MFEWYSTVQWRQISALLNSGNPSILQQLIVVNAISLAVIVFIRVRRKTTVYRRPKYFIQEILLLANMFILTENQFSAFLHNSVIPMVYQFRQYAN